MLASLVLAAVNGTWAEGTEGTITFSNQTGSTAINAASVTGDDSQKNTWTITTEGTTSFTANAAYYQVGSANKPATSITFTTTLSKDQNITAFSAKFGGFSGTTGTVTLKVNDTTVGTGSISASTDVTVSSSSTAEGKVLTVTVTGIDKGIKAYYISYTYIAASDPQKTNVTLTFPQASYTATMGQSFAAPTATASPSVSGITYSSDATGVATVDNETGAVTLVSAGTAHITASYDGDDTHNAATSVSYTLTVNPTPYTVTLGDDSSTLTEETGGAGVTLPTRTAIGDYAFAGWSSTNVASETTEVPTIIDASETYYPTADITLYPVYSKTEGGSSINTDNVFDSGSYNNETITWSIANVVSIKQEQNGSGNTAPSSSYVSAPRWYSKNLITITPSVSVNKITVTATSAGYATTLSTSTYTNASASVSESTVTITPTNGSNPITIYMGGQSRLSSLIINYGGGTTYYWSAPVAATVERPIITVANNPFLFSTTATITCATDGAAIKYSYDGETWNDYSSALTLTATTTIYAKATKDSDESATATMTATKNLAEPTVSIDAASITNTNVFTGTAAGSLTASVTYNGTVIDGASVTWTGDNDAVATINTSTGAVTLVAAGSVTFTATYAGNGDYSEQTSTYAMTVENFDPEAPGAVSNPYSVAQAKQAIDDAGKTTIANKHVTGIVSQVDSYSNSKYITYWISDDGTTTDQFEVYKGLNINGVAFSAKTDIQVGDEVVIYGDITYYSNSSVYEFAQDNHLISQVHQVIAPSFSPVEGAVLAGTEVTINTTTDDATIYYTTDGTTPTTESSVYSTPITINTAMTIKAIAVKEGMNNSTVSTATYTITVAPTIIVSTNTIEAVAPGTNGTITVTYGNITEVIAEVKFYEQDGTTETTYDWITAEINDDNNIDYIIDANSGDARTAYMKVYALDDEANDVYSELITISQVAPNYATLPFAFDGGNSDIASIRGLTQSGLGSDYSSSPKLKFDTTGDGLLLKINENPGALTFDIKGNSFSGGTFTVQTSADNETFTDLATYTVLGETRSEMFNLAPTVRYIKWIYTKKSSGNVALGNISLISNYKAKVTSVGYATFAAPAALDFSETAIKAYIAKANGTTGVTFHQIDKVPANTGVLLVKENGTTEVIPALIGDADATTGNVFKVGTGAAVTSEDGTLRNYILNKVGDVLGFYRAAGQVVATDKAYIQIDEANGNVKGFIALPGFEDETGIHEMVNGTSVNGKWYNLSGQRVNRAQKGIFIVNGKKVAK